MRSGPSFRYTRQGVGYMAHPHRGGDKIDSIITKKINLTTRSSQVIDRSKAGMTRLKVIVCLCQVAAQDGDIGMTHQALEREDIPAIA